MPLVQAAQNKREWLKTVGVLGLATVLVTALFGAILGAPASLLAVTIGSQRTMAQILQVTFVATGILMMVVALGEFGLIRRVLLPLHFAPAPVDGAADTTPRTRYRQAAVLGLWSGATFGIVCTMPLYLALLVYVGLVGSIAYGALVLGTYGLGLTASIALAGLILLPASRAGRFNAWLASREEAFHLVQGLVFAALGAMSVSFFWLRYTVPPS
jgi:cytochrome c biogenesis protein CcdA